MTLFRSTFRLFLMCVKKLSPLLKTLMKKRDLYLPFLLLLSIVLISLTSCGILGHSRSLSVDSVYIHNLQYNTSISANLKPPL
ncbi:MAG: hypothetical protein [Microviridae sp.]|nr:MAG: hypothetical protein [Microviridae sp.]